MLGFAAAVALLELLYAGIFNACLSSDYLRRLAVSQPDRIAVEWRRARTWWPGVVHLTGVQVRAQSRKAQWIASAEHARVGLRMLPLAWRHFDVTSFHGSGVQFWLRMRETGNSKAIDEEPYWPVIPGLPPALGPKTQPPPKPVHPWTLRVGRCQLEHVRDVWIDGLRLRGDGTVEGAVKTRIRDWVEIPHASLHVAEARIELGPHLASEKIAIDSAVTIRRFATMGATPQGVFSGLSGTLRADGPLTSFAALDRFFERAPWTKLDGAGEVAIDLHVDRGLLAPGTTIATEDSQIALRMWQQEVRGSASVLGTVSPGNPPRARILVMVRDFELARGEREPAYAHGTGFRFTAEREGTDFKDRQAPLRLRVDLPESEVTRFEVYGAYLPASAGLTVRSGTGKMRGFFELATDTMTGTGAFDLRGEKLAAAFGDLPLRGDVKLAFALAPLPGDRSDREAPAFALNDARFEVTDVHLGDSRQAPAWWGRLTLQNGTLALKPPAVAGAFRSELLDTRPLASMLAEKSKWFALLHQALLVRDVRAEGSIDMHGDAMGIRDLTVAGNDVDVKADLDFEPSGKTGLLYARKGVFHIAVALEAGGHRDWKLVNAEEWFEAQRKRRRAAAGDAANGGSTAH